MRARWRLQGYQPRGWLISLGICSGSARDLLLLFGRYPRCTQLTKTNDGAVYQILKIPRRPGYTRKAGAMLACDARVYGARARAFSVAYLPVPVTGSNLIGGWLETHPKGA